MEFIHEGLYKRRQAGVACFDIENVFDRVWHSSLICKLIKHRLPTPLIHFIYSYLLGMSFIKVSHVHNTSTVRNIDAGVQGSKLGSVFFNLYVNDISLQSHTTPHTTTMSTNSTAMSNTCNTYCAPTYFWTLIRKMRVNLCPSKMMAIFFNLNRIPLHRLKYIINQLLLRWK